MDDYVEWLFALGLAARTVGVYCRAVERWIFHAIEEGIDPLEPKPIDLATYAQTLPHTASSKRQHRVAIRHYLEANGRDASAVAAIRVPPKRRYVSRALEPEEAGRLARVSRGWHPEGTAILFGLYLGLRRNEIAIARWDRFDPCLEWYRVLGKMDVEAELPVHPVLRDQLEGRMSAYPWIFPGRSSAHVGASTVAKWCELVGREAGLVHLTPHVLRHTAIATINDETGDLRAAQEFARHADPNTTRIYTRVTARRLQRAVAALRYEDVA